MDKEFLKYMPTHIKEMYNPELKRERIAKEKQKQLVHKLTTYSKAAVGVVQRQKKEMNLTQEEKKALHYSNNPSDELIETLTGIVLKAFEADKTTRNLLYESYRVISGSFPKLAVEIHKAINKR